MGNVVLLPVVLVHINTITGSVEHAGKQYTWIFESERNRLRIWMMRLGQPIPDDVPQEITQMVIERVERMLEAGERK